MSKWKLMAVFMVASAVLASNPLGVSGQGSEPRKQQTTLISTQPGEPLLQAEREHFVKLLFANPRVAYQLKNHRVRVLRVISEPGDKGAPASRVVTATVFDYTTDTAFRYELDAMSGALISDQALSGVPQPSIEEREEAARIIQQDRGLGPLLKAGNILEGGFGVTNPKGSTPRNRYVFFQILAPGRSEIIQIVVVNLTLRQIASSRKIASK